jgi:hypothetical protein
VALSDEDATREWVGSAPTSAEILAALVRYDDDPLLAARSILSRKLADLAMAPGELSVDQDASRKWLEWQVELLERRIAAVSGAADDETSDGLSVQMTVARLTRPPVVR